MGTVVTWSTKGRAIFAIAIPLLAWLGWWSFNSPTNPSPPCGYLAFGGVVAAVALQIHFATYRVETGPRGITETFLWGQRLVGWDGGWDDCGSCTMGCGLWRLHVG